MRLVTTACAVFSTFLCSVAFNAPAKAASGGAAYCKSVGGKVVLRTPEYGTNNPTPLVLANPQQFCDFSMKSQGNTTYIEVPVATLAATQPTLAALAYYSQTPYNSTGCKGSPASCYCAQLGGTDSWGGVNANGGAWVNNTAAIVDMDACVFPDMSAIDAWGLTYHSAGIIRGADLSTKFAYKNPN